MRVGSALYPNGETALMTSDVRLEEDYKLNRYVCFSIGLGCVCVCICSPRWRLSFYKSRLTRSDKVAGMLSRAQNGPRTCSSHNSYVLSSVEDMSIWSLAQLKRLCVI